MGCWICSPSLCQPELLCFSYDLQPKVHLYTNYLWSSRSLSQRLAQPAASCDYVFYLKAGTNHQGVFQGLLPCYLCNWLWNHVNIAALLRIHLVSEECTGKIHICLEMLQESHQVSDILGLYIWRKTAITLSKMSRIAARHC